LGVLSWQNFDEFLSVQKFNDADRKFNYLQNFSVLDKTKERENYQIGVVYAPKGQDVDVFECQGGSGEYVKFVKNLGWLVNLNNHTGFFGGLDPKVTGPIAPYYAAYDVEVVFQVATLMPNKESVTKQIHKTRLINNNKVLISWAEDLDSYRPPADSAYTTNIIIHPLPSQLFQLKIMLRGDDIQSLPFIGPALDNMVVSSYVLASIVRQTAINAARFSKEDRSKPITIRRFMIEDFVQRNKVELTAAQYFASHFVS